jgi:hypothetical protein
MAAVIQQLTEHKTNTNTKFITIMALSCIPKSVLSSASCQENPSGVSNHLFVVPLANVGSIVADDAKNQYNITLPTSQDALQGYRIDYKSQTGQVTSEDNGTGKGWTGSTTGRVEMSEDDMAYTARVLHNSDKNLYFVATGNKKAGTTEGTYLDEYIVIGNENGEAEIQVYMNRGKSFIELESQGAYTTLKPGAKLEWTVKWYLLPVNAQQDIQKECRNLITTLLGK